MSTVNSQINEEWKTLISRTQVLHSQKMQHSKNLAMCSKQGGQQHSISTVYSRRRSKKVALVYTMCTLKSSWPCRLKMWVYNKYGCHQTWICVMDFSKSTRRTTRNSKPKNTSIKVPHLDIASLSTASSKYNSTSGLPSWHLLDPVATIVPLGSLH